jgi:hypothetical protein
MPHSFADRLAVVLTSATYVSDHHRRVLRAPGDVNYFTAFFAPSSFTVAVTWCGNDGERPDLPVFVTERADRRQCVDGRGTPQLDACRGRLGLRCLDQALCAVILVVGDLTITTPTDHPRGWT